MLEDSSIQTFFFFFFLYMVGDFTVAESLISPYVFTGERNKFLRGLCDFFSVSRKPPLPERTFEGKGAGLGPNKNACFVLQTQGQVALAFCSAQGHARFLFLHQGFLLF